VTALDETVAKGLLDTCVVIDLDMYRERGQLPRVGFISAVTMAELHFGAALARDPLEASVRSERIAALRSWARPLPFDAAAAEKYGDLAALVAGAGRHPRSRRLDLMIAATALVHDLPVVTSNPDDFRGLEPILEVVPVSRAA
jgi:predicted nucleic acid-binding protein